MHAVVQRQVRHSVAEGRVGDDSGLSGDAARLDHSEDGDVMHRTVPALHLVFLYLPDSPIVYRLLHLLYEACVGASSQHVKLD